MHKSLKAIKPCKKILKTKKKAFKKMEDIVGLLL
jgi:hypothetical protein